MGSRSMSQDFRPIARIDRERAAHSQVFASRVSIGRVARLTGLTVRAIRLYEERGLVAADRDRRGVRCYDCAAVDRLLQVAALRAIGLTLSEISGVIALDDAEDRLRGLLAAHHARLSRQLRAIRATAGQLGMDLERWDDPQGPVAMAG